MRKTAKQMVEGVLKGLVLSALRRQRLADMQVLGFSKGYDRVKLRHMGKRGQWVTGSVRYESLFPESE